jgi:hypothetical protein
MRVKSLHGYFIFEEHSVGELSKFMTQYEVEIERDGDLYTFADLVGAPEYAIAGGVYLGAPVTVTYEGKPWEIMKQNNLVYDFRLGLMVPILSVLLHAEYSLGQNYFMADGLIQPGSITDDGSRVKDYAAWYSFDSKRFRYTEVISG